MIRINWLKKKPYLVEIPLQQQVQLSPRQLKEFAPLALAQQYYHKLVLVQISKPTSESDSSKELFDRKHQLAHDFIVNEFFFILNYFLYGTRSQLILVGIQVTFNSNLPIEIIRNSE